MEINGVQGTIEFDGEFVTITKKLVGARAVPHRLHISGIKGVTLKPASRMFFGYVQLLGDGGEPERSKKPLTLGGRPPQEDRNSLSFPNKVNAPIAELVAAVEARIVELSR